MDLNLIGIFVEIVESQSLSAAARKLGMTRANISQRLKQLERETGAQLLRRSTRSLELTQAGHTLYDCGQRMLDDLSTARASIESLGLTLTGRIRISVPTGCGRMFIGRILIGFARAHPGITLHVTFKNRIDDLIAEEVDVALSVPHSPPLDCVARNICTINWHLYASSAYVETHGPINIPADLNGHALLAAPHPERRVTMTLVHLQNEDEAHPITLRPALQSTDYPFLAEAACDGLGIGLLPAYISQAPANRTLLRILPQYRVTGQQDVLYIVTLPNRYPSPATQALIDYLRAQIVSLSQTWT
ncbi:DNA-binding transcriptional LysR family regulator [Paraburkholderia bannensis]|uniref:DNA-binding transcriptional LysR family regulator n=1 Tax=Paraburkholderia bannensis TaxID=765414 RepID=A0A7W9WTJ5_9BURK|nr:MULTISPECIES: LysR family transcriptional regulator [Paraburkholderia]MBB3258650.1 DNA-binding transcriptional LysR family regulator [Paraburkholderia sp. WP4_3_2]MBB6103664.1 DNA-binding transcriptional LysR family regulator [Paraburkholderia bannensis]